MNDQWSTFILLLWFDKLIGKQNFLELTEKQLLKCQFSIFKIGIPFNIQIHFKISSKFWNTYEKEIFK